MWIWKINMRQIAVENDTNYTKNKKDWSKRPHKK